MCPVSPVQHVAPVPEGWSADALLCDFAGLPLPQHLSTVSTRALFRGRAETERLPQGVFLLSQSGPGPCSKVEGQYLPWIPEYSALIL